MTYEQSPADDPQSDEVALFLDDDGGLLVRGTLELWTRCLQDC